MLCMLAGLPQPTGAAARDASQRARSERQRLPGAGVTLAPLTATMALGARAVPCALRFLQGHGGASRLGAARARAATSTNAQECERCAHICPGAHLAWQVVYTHHLAWQSRVGSGVGMRQSDPSSEEGSPVGKRAAAPPAPSPACPACCKWSLRGAALASSLLRLRLLAAAAQTTTSPRLRLPAVPVQHMSRKQHSASINCVRINPRFPSSATRPPKRRGSEAAAAAAVRARTAAAPPRPPPASGTRPAIPRHLGTQQCVSACTLPALGSSRS